MRFIRFVALLLPLTAGGGRVTTVARADILRIEASQCAGDQPRRVGTGFAWRSSREVVTALHVIAGCQNVLVHSENDQQKYGVSVSRVLKRADLALVTVTDAGARFPPLVESQVQAAPNLVLTAWGYGEGSLGMRDFSPLRVAHGPPSLRENLPPAVARDIQRAGAPALDLTVIPIDAPLAPGLSGAPLLDADGKVRAIADGGVAHGITHVSWAVPARYLAELAQSTETTSGITASSVNLSAAEATRAEVFSADFVDPTVGTVNCGTARLRRARRRTLAEAEVGNDSPLGLQQLKGAFANVPATFEFDVYEDATSGATIVVPAGAPLQQQGSACRVSLAANEVDMVVSVTRVPLNSNQEILAIQFEMFAATQPIQLWMPDVWWSYSMPFYRPDGLVVRRKAFAHMVPNAYGVPTEYMFETLAVRNGTFIGVAAIRHSDLPMQLCTNRLLFGAQCPSENYLSTWARAALSVQLATFAISALNPNLSTWQQLVGRGGL